MRLPTAPPEAQRDQPQQGEDHHEHMTDQRPAALRLWGCVASCRNRRRRHHRRQAGSAGWGAGRGLDRKAGGGQFAVCQGVSLGIPPI